MKNRNLSRSGFTLVELLVVVLIVGILSSAAWPSFEMAIWRARASEGWITINEIRKSMEVYQLTYRKKPSSFLELENLPADFKKNKNKVTSGKWEYTLEYSSGYTNSSGNYIPSSVSVLGTLSNSKNRAVLALRVWSRKDIERKRGSNMCCAYQEKRFGSICKSLTQSNSTGKESCGGNCTCWYF